MSKYRLLIALLLMISAPFMAHAETGTVDFFHYAGKFYGVVAVIGVLFIGFISFLIWTDLKVARLEKIANEKNQ